MAIGDWLALISPIMKDLSASSTGWWESIVSEAADNYEKWLNAEPLTKIQLQPQLPRGCLQQPWLRLEQLASTMLLKALPEKMKAEALASRATSSVELLYRALEGWARGRIFFVSWWTARCRA